MFSESEMVERIAKAICKSRTCEGAIEAMREPTEEMARAFHDNGGPEDDFWPIEWYGDRQGFDNALGRMIDAALAHK